MSTSILLFLVLVAMSANLRVKSMLLEDRIYIANVVYVTLKANGYNKE